MMNKADFLARCHYLTEFCLEHGKECFYGWTSEKLFWFIGYNGLAGTLFVNEQDGQVNAVGVAWTDSADKIIERERTGECHFAWKLPPKGDALVIAGVVGDRKSCAELYRKALKKWPFVKRYFTWRQGNLVELPPETLARFAT